jgi:hypothetical protein
MTRIILGFFLLFSLSTFASLRLEEQFLSTENIAELGINRASELFYSELTFEKQQDGTQAIATIKVSHGWLNLGVGSGKAYLKTNSSHQIVNLSIDVTVGLFGINQRIKESISISKLLSGKSLKFFMDGATKAALLIEPSSSFSKTGGHAKIKILNEGGGYNSESISFTKDSSGKYSIKQNTRTIKELFIQMRGLDVKTMYVGDYDFK